MKNHIPEHIKALAYLYQRTLSGIGATNHSYGKQPEGNHYFRNHFNRRGELESLVVITVWDKHLGKKFKRYFLHPNDYVKAEALLNSYNLL